jgi:hypothetical protein
MDTLHEECILSNVYDNTDMQKWIWSMYLQKYYIEQIDAKERPGHSLAQTEGTV